MLTSGTSPLHLLFKVCMIDRDRQHDPGTTEMALILLHQLLYLQGGIHLLWPIFS